MENRVQRAGLEHLEALLALVRAYYTFDGHPYEERRVRAALQPLLAGSPFGVVWVLTDGDALHGYLALTFGWSVEYGGPDAFVDEAFVKESARGKGLGRALFATAEAEAYRRGVRHLHLEVTAENEYAREAYRRWGYEEHGRTLMTKALDVR